MKDISAKFETGSADRLELMQSQLRLLEIELDMAKVNVDLANIERQILQRAGKE